MPLTWNKFETNDEDSNKTIKKFAIFMNNGQVITIDAFDYEWGSERVQFFGDKFTYDDGNIIATFKTSVLYAVSQCCFDIAEKQLALPMYKNEFADDTEEDTEKENN